jgi:hypothetical protein
LEEATVRSGYEVLMKVDENILLIVGKPQGIFNQQLSGLYYKHCYDHKLHC